MLEPNNSENQLHQIKPNTTEEKQDSSTLIVKERYVELLDLRNITSQSLECIKQNSNKESTREYSRTTGRYLSNYQEFNRITGQSLSRSKKVKKSITTAIIAERIVNKNLEIQRDRKYGESKLYNFPMDKINQMIAKRILETEDRISRENRILNQKSIRENQDVIKKLIKYLTKVTSSKSLQKLKVCKSTCIPDSFFTAQNTSMIQKQQENLIVVNNLKGNNDTNEEISNITDSKSSVEEFKTIINVTPISLIQPEDSGDKCLQTDAPILINKQIGAVVLNSNNPTKFTNTEELYYPSQDRATQFYEYLTCSDLFCLEWVNKHLFEIHLNPHGIIIDEKIRAVSEIVNHSSFLSNISVDCEL